MTKRGPLSTHLSFNAQHSPMGAFMSFTCGNFGTRGGIGLQIGQPGDQEVFIGFKEGDRYSDATLKCLPFYVGAVNRAADAFLVEQAGPSEQNVKPDAVPFKDGEFARSYGWATDEWQRRGTDASRSTRPLARSPIPANDSDEQMREGLLPAVVARLELDNTNGTDHQDRDVRAEPCAARQRGFSKTIWAAGRLGFAFRREAGGAAELFDFTASRTRRSRRRRALRLHALVGQRRRARAPQPGPSAGLLPRIWLRSARRARSTASTIALGSYLEGFQTNGLDGRYLYTRYFKGLADVLKTALDRAARSDGRSAERSTANSTPRSSPTISASSSRTPRTATTAARNCWKSKASRSGW